MLTVVACRWLDDAVNLSPLRRALVRRAHADIGIEENTTNRSPYIDEVVTEAGSPLGSAWCACIARRWANDAGAQYPSSEAGRVQHWVDWAKANGTWHDNDGSYVPQPGDFVCYDFEPDQAHWADHMGLIARVHAKGPRSIEGNTSYGGQSREGVTCTFKPTLTAKVKGYIEPRPTA